MEYKQWQLAKRPVGEPTRENWQLASVTLPDVDDGQIAVKIKYISLDPAMRGWMNDGK